MKTLLMIAFLVPCIGCRVNPDLEAEKTELLRLHEAQRRAHFDRNVDPMTEGHVPQRIQISGGELSYTTPEQTRARFERYFGRVEFLRWDDTIEPIIVVSDDATLANTFVQKLVVVSYQDERGAKQLDTTRFAWTTTYRKINDQWQMIAVTSTRK
ncbi:MAG TPA: hypothetical protein PKV06_14470 [bacterium]|nr:hypothetical protein [bacterium]HNH33797.1 hypothetical protein [bacterium]